MERSYKRCRKNPLRVCDVVDWVMQLRLNGRWRRCGTRPFRSVTETASGRYRTLHYSRENILLVLVIPPSALQWYSSGLLFDGVFHQHLRHSLTFLPRWCFFVCYSVIYFVRVAVRWLNPQQINFLLPNSKEIQLQEPYLNKYQSNRLMLWHSGEILSGFPTLLCIIRGLFLNPHQLCQENLCHCSTVTTRCAFIEFR